MLGMPMKIRLLLECCLFFNWYQNFTKITGVATAIGLKQIVELVMSPKHNDSAIAYLESKISDHSIFFNRLLPKHQYYLEHYPTLIRFFGPLVGVWKVKFETKFFKRKTLFQFPDGQNLSVDELRK